MSVKVGKQRCPQNHACPAISVCPADAISQEGFSAPVIDQEACISCGACTYACPTGALTME